MVSGNENIAEFRVSVHISLFPKAMKHLAVDRESCMNLRQTHIGVSKDNGTVLVLLHFTNSLNNAEK